MRRLGSVRWAGVTMAFVCVVMLWWGGTDSAFAQSSPEPSSGILDSMTALRRPPDASAGPACDTLELNYPVDETPIFDLNDLLPTVVRDQILLKRYIRDPRFLGIRRLCSDTSAVDAIFLRALDIADGDAGRALLIALLGTMDHFKLGIRIPLLGVLWLPLTTETDSVFRLRHAHLPGRVLPDSAGRSGSDKDKLQHFFGSAYIAYLTNSRALANMFGNVIEEGEEAIVVGGVNDERDKFANRLGQEFGLRLLEEDDVVPSDVLWKKMK